MSNNGPGGFEREVRDIVVKSGLTGVAATMLAVTIFSPAGFGGLVGTSLASGLGGEANRSPASNPYANLPAFPAPLTVEEISDIRGQIASTTASMEITRAATEPRIERVRSLAMADGLVSFTTRSAPAPVVPRLSASMPPVRTPELAQAAPAELRLELTESVAALSPVVAPVEVTSTPISYIVVDGALELRPDPNLELAELLLTQAL